MRTLCFDLEVVTQDKHADRVFSEPFPADTWKPTGNASKPETIARQKEEAEAAWDAGRAERCDALCLSPRTGRIVCVEAINNLGEHFGRDATHEDSEYLILEVIWHEIDVSQLLIGFNSHQFDLPYLIVRSAVLGVQPALHPQRLAALLWRHKYSPHFDVRMVLAAWDMRAPGTLSGWCETFGIACAETDGAAIGQMHRDGRHDEIAAKCRADVEATHQLYQRLAPYYLSEAA